MKIRISLLYLFIQEESVKTLGAEGLFLFSSLDTDHDLYLSPEEFKPIAEKLTGTPHTIFNISLCLAPLSQSLSLSISLSLSFSIPFMPCLISSHWVKLRCCSLICALACPLTSDPFYGSLQELHLQWSLMRKWSMTLMERLWLWRPKCSLCCSTPWQRAKMDSLG